ncbi:DegV family protein [Anaerofilum sp. BX8]|uniref:DegV family protein n=1 Tax=Anaerofilum hominis TaxID=2763016 RepID=A0A923I4Z7_9FIRM|nr:DegV family protein [Anaerofilum hominis]MBC5580398.1 DegV family protein [Anaerofilum hominis]
MSQKVILSADSPCDLGPELQRRYDVHFYPFHILLGEASYTDSVDIQPDDLYRAWRERRLLPKTAAVTPLEYAEYFRPWVEAGYEVVHVSIGSALSSGYQNCCVAARSLGHVYPVNSCNLSTGIGLLVLRAGELIRQGMPAAEIQQTLNALVPCSHASFVLDTLEFMRAGGRCSAVAAFGANLLHLKPCIQVHTEKEGAMGVGKKYRGSMETVLPAYIRDQLSAYRDPVPDHVFLTHSGVPENWLQVSRKAVEEAGIFREIHITRASCTISAHCGPGTLGVLFLTKS